MDRFVDDCKNAAVIVRAGTTQEPTFPFLGKYVDTVSGPDRCGYDGGNGVIVLGIVDSADDGFARLVNIPCEDVQDGRDRLQKVGGARIPDRAGIKNGLIKMCGNMVSNKLPERS